MAATVKAGRIVLEYDDPHDARAVADVLDMAARREDGTVRDYGFYDDACALRDAADEIDRREATA